MRWLPTPVLLPGKSHGWRSLVGCSPWGRTESDTTERLPFHALEKEMATHSSVLAWRIPGMGEPGGLPSMGSHSVGHDWSDLAAAVSIHGVLQFFFTFGYHQLTFACHYISNIHQQFLWVKTLGFASKVLIPDWLSLASCYTFFGIITCCVL